MKVLFPYGGYENLGIEYLSAVLREAGHHTALAFDPRLFDDHYTRIPPLARLCDFRPALIEKARAERPDLVAFSVVTEDYAWACDIARELKASLDVPVVFGGVHVSSVPQRVMANDFVDFAVVGEGEHALLELVQCLEQGEPLNQIPNLWFKQDRQVLSNPPRPLIQDLDSLPFPHKGLFYDELPFLKYEYLTMTSRGCPNRCTYCFNNHMQRLYRGKGRYVRRRSPGDVLEELVLARSSYPLKRVQFYDDIFASKVSWLEQFSSGYRREIALPFWCSVNPYFINSDAVRILAEMGCCEVQMGVQTINPRLRKDILRRPESVAQIERAVSLFHSSGIKCVVDNISGIPGEQEEHLVESLRFYNKVRPSRISDYYLRYYPSTEIVRIAEEMGCLDAEKIEQLEQGQGSESFALGGTETGQPNQARLHSLLSVMLLLPPYLNELILSHKLYRLFPKNDFTARALIRLIDVFKKKDINAERYYRKYLHFIRKLL